jgi:hypothetical protein
MSEEMDYALLGAQDQQLQASLVAGLLWRAAKYIIERRPHELVTIAILNEKAYDIYDAMDGARRAKQIN